MIKRIISLFILPSVLLFALLGCQPQQNNGGKTGVEILKGGAHEYINDAYEIEFNNADNDGFSLEAVRFVDDENLLVVRSNKLDYKYYLCNIEQNTVKALPDVLKNADIYSFDQVLKNGDMFFKLTSTSRDEGLDNDYVIIDGSTLEVKKKIDAPDGVDHAISISPDASTLVYQRDLDLYSADLDFENETLLLKARVDKNDETFNEVPRYGVFYNNNTILYRWLGYEWTNYCGTIDKTGKNNRRLPNTHQLALVVTNKPGKFFYIDMDKFEYGVYDWQSGSKKSVFKETDGLIISYVFNKDLTYFVTCFAYDMQEYTGSKMEIYSFGDSKKKAEFVKKDALMHPMSLSISPNGNKMAFLDGLSSGEWKLYIMNMDKYN